MDGAEGNRGRDCRVALLPADLLPRARELRLNPGAEAAADPETGEWWLRCPGSVAQAVTLPFRELYRLDETSGRLFLPNSGVPVRSLPRGLRWIPLRELLQPEEIDARPPEEWTGGRSRLRLRRGGDATGAQIVMVDLGGWIDFALSAPEVRLRRWRFAASDHSAVIWGTPLPPLEGSTWREEEGIALPTGYVLEPALAPSLVRGSLGASAGELILFYPDGSVDRIAGENFIPASRAAARLIADS